MYYGKSSSLELLKISLSLHLLEPFQLIQPFHTFNRIQHRKCPQKTIPFPLLIFFLVLLHIIHILFPNILHNVHIFIHIISIML